MEETEPEEGEACCSPKDDDSAIDPDLALSYIEEKLQDVLGHFQKDFEGGVSAENLGAKFGGYGSFLPSYQRSPVWSHPKAPLKVHNYSSPRSPNSVHLESGYPNSLVASTASLSTMLGPTSANAASLPLMRSLTTDDSVKHDLGMSSTCKDSISICEHMNNFSKPSSKKLKLRIKVGSDNLLTKRNAEIYSGLGLDVSPYSTLYDSHSDSEGLSYDPQAALDGSPTSILQIMTSFPVQGGLLISPLPDDLIYFSEKQKFQGESRYGAMDNGSREYSVMLVNESDSTTDDHEVLGDKKPRSFEKNAFSVELKDIHDKNAHNHIDVLAKEKDIDTSACEELVSNALKLPLLAISYCNVVDSGKGTTRVVDISMVANKSIVKGESFSDLAKEEHLGAALAQDIGQVELPNRKTVLAGKAWEENRANHCDHILVDPRKEGNSKGEKTVAFVKAGSNVSNGREALNAEFIYPSKQKNHQKSTPHEEDGHGKEHSSSEGGKKISKERQNHEEQGAEILRDNIKMDCSLLTKNIKPAHANSSLHRSEGDNIKLQNDYGKSIDRNRDFLGNIELVNGNNDLDSMRMTSADMLKDTEVVEKSTFTFNRELKQERLNQKKIVRSSSSEAYREVTSHVLPLPANRPISDATPGMAASVDEDGWVECDNCRKWRLLTSDTVRDSLPENWVCSMLNWLPGMNHCSISQEETTKAVIALYQVSASEGKSNQHIHPNGVVSRVTPCSACHFEQNHQNLVSHTSPCGGKKHGLKVSDATNQDGSTEFPSSMKTLQTSVKSRSPYVVNQSPPVNELEVQHLNKSSSTVMVSHKHNKKKNKLFGHYSVEVADTKSSSTKSKRLTDQDCSGASKKIKIDDMHIIREDWISDHGEAVMKVSPSSSWETERNKYSDRSSSKDSKCNTRNNLQVAIGNLKAQVQVASDEGSLQMGKYVDIDIAVRKREGYECQDTQIYSVGVEKTSDNDHRKRKKARLSKPEGKEKNVRKGLDGAPEKVRSMKDQQLAPDLGCGLSIRHSVAATSSSSKLCGSHENKDNLQEVKGSSVDLMSSPPRTLNPHFTGGDADTLDHGTQYPCKPQTSNQCHHEEKGSNNQYPVNAFHQKKFGKGCSSQSKDKNGSSKSDFDRVGIMISDSFNEMTGHTLYEENSGDGNNRFEKKSGLNSFKVEENYAGKKDSAEKPIESNERDKGFDVKGDSISSHDQKLNLRLDHVGERSSKRFLSDKTIRGISRREKAHSLPPSGRGQNERELHGPKLIPGSDKENKVNTLSSDEYVGDNPLKAPKQICKAENQGGNQRINSRHPTPSNHKVRDLDAPISVRRDSSTQAAINAVKEAKDLKHLADRLKNSGSNLESTGFYFQAALKFLYGASKFESCNSENRKHSDMIQSMEIYSSTARLCEFCAREYEKCEDMAAAALAYKCMEVAYMRVIYSSHASTNRDRNELQMALQIIPPGESPSSSASNVDNLNNAAIVDKSVLTKGCSSPQIAGNYIIAARNHSSFVRLLNFAQNVNFAMEASRKSRNAFAAANSRLEEAKNIEGMTSIKRALDFNFQDVDELLQLIRLAMESITR